MVGSLLPWPSTLTLHWSPTPAPMAVAHVINEWPTVMLHADAVNTQGGLLPPVPLSPLLTEEMELVSSLRFMEGKIFKLEVDSLA